MRSSENNSNTKCLFLLLCQISQRKHLLSGTIFNIFFPLLFVNNCVYFLLNSMVAIKRKMGNMLPLDWKFLF